MARTKPTACLMVTRSSRTLTRARAAKRKEQNAASAFLSSTREAKPKPKAPPSRKKTTKKKPTNPKPKLYAVGKKVRVWWPPTRNKKRTDFSGAYWPARVVDCFEGGYRVEYDNLEREDIDSEDVSPATPPVAFGEETTPLAEKEFCEVFNSSETDPSAWLAQIYKAEGENYIINFPFHDSDPEVVAAIRVRRARVFDEASRTWKVIKPGQEWEDGEISSPTELELIDQTALPTAIDSLKEAGSSAAMKITGDGRKYKDLNSLMNGAASQSTAALAHAFPQPAHNLPPTFQGREGRSRSKRKDPNAPKKPRSAYVFFMEKDRKTVKDENPTMRPQHIMKLVGENWAKLTAEEREEFEEMSREDRLRYLRDMKDYTPPEALADEPGAKRAKMEKDWPRKPLTAFVIFSKELRQQMGSEMTFTEKTKKIAEAWREMSDERKESYQTAAKEDKERYDKEVAELEAEEQEQSKAQQAMLMRKFADVTSIDFQPRPLTRSGASVFTLDEETKKILEEFDLHKVRDEIMEHFVEEAYYLLLDVWREGSERVGDAIRAYRAHIAGQEQPDWRAFYTSVVGVESTQSLLKPVSVAPEVAPCEAAAAAAPEEAPPDAPVE